MKNTLDGNKILESITIKRGYKIYNCPLNGSIANHTQKIIRLNACITDERNIKLSHELGHIYIFKIWKWFVVINELMAWIVGYFICKRNKVNTKGFWKIVNKSLKTYIKV